MGLSKGAFGLRGASATADQEAEVLIPLIVTKASRSGAVGASQFVTAKLESNLKRYIKRAPDLKVSYRFIGLFTFAAGLTSTGLAALSKSTPTRITIAILGILVGLASHTLQIWRPAERATAYYRARRALLDEGWSYVNDAGIYAPLTNSARAQFVRFQTQVMAIQAAAASVDEQTAATGAAGGTAGKPRDATENAPNAGG